jgi:putative membrane protein
MLRTSTWIAAACIAALATAGCNKSHKTAKSSGGTTRTYSSNEPGPAMVPADVSFLQYAAMGGHGEIELASIAARQASRADVRDYAQMIVNDHTMANNQIGDLAVARGIVLPSQPDTPHRVEADRLLATQSSQFDVEFLRQMIDDHTMAIQVFQGRAQYSQDVQVQRFAADTLPALQKHLEMAQQLAYGSRPPPVLEPMPRQ